MNQTKAEMPLKRRRFTEEFKQTRFAWCERGLHVHRRRKGAVKLHTLLDLAARAASGNRGSIPCFVHISHRKIHAVTTQVWIMITVYVLVAIVKMELQIDRSLYEILQILKPHVVRESPRFYSPQRTHRTKLRNPFPNQHTLFDLEPLR